VKVSAIIPVRNGSRYVLEAIASCRAQTVPPAEIIVVDDGSTDGTAEFIRAASIPDVRVVEQPWLGVGRALNAAIATADPDAAFLAFLDHDDLWLPDKTELQLAAMTSNDALEAVFGHVVQFISADVAPEEAAKLEAPIEAQPGPTLSAMLLRRSAVSRLGPFPETRDAFAFPPWYVSAQHEGIASEMLMQTVVRRRVHLSNSTRTGRDHYNDAYLGLARAAILHRRSTRK
jgi:glycosyltransferase involved in cell wall biosynthesis